MTVQRFTPVATAAISLSEHGAYVKYEDYEKLAVENAMLKSVADGWCELPATDAYLAGIKAYGVEQASEELISLAARGEASAPISAEATHAAALYIKLIARQLREGADK